ncbi:MAG: prepilin-type N-terminal cleavage/methylation domain-containing protein [Planctomycetota bacterium]
MAPTTLDDGTAGSLRAAPPPALLLRRADREPPVPGAEQGRGEARPVDASAGSRAFTAIELMVVIAIILILVGLLVPTISGIRGRARKQTAATRLKGISIALDRHFLDRGFYPPDTGTFAGFPKYTTMQLGNDLCQDNDAQAPALYKDDPYTLYKYLCGPEGQGVYDATTGRTYGPYIQFEESELRDESVSAGDPCAKIALDPWGRPWVYEEHRSIGKLKASKRQADFPNWRAHNRDRYDIYSVGPDGLLDSGAKGMHNGRDDDDDDLIDEVDEAKYDGRDNDGDGNTDDSGEVGDDITNW